LLHKDGGDIGRNVYGLQLYNLDKDSWTKKLKEEISIRYSMYLAELIRAQYKPARKII
jgi:hypothetical protein